MYIRKIFSLGLILLFNFYSKTAKSQFCGCFPTICCSQRGFCGVSDEYCGFGCKSGPCRKVREPLEKIVTQEFFSGIISKGSNGCAGKRFYTRDSFLEAANATFDFNTTVTRLEIASIFAHFTHLTEHFCYIEEVNSTTSPDYCDQNYKEQYQCAQNKSYSPRGPIKLTWNYNYGPCGQNLNLDLLRQPELVASNATVAFRTGLWFWMEFVRPLLNQGFGASIQAINAMDCNGGNPSAVNAKVGYYNEYCKQLGVVPGNNVTC